MATVPKPPRRKAARKPAPAPAMKTGFALAAERITGTAAPVTTMHRPAGKLVDLNFKVDPDFHARFKVEAATRRMAMVELLRAAFEAYAGEDAPVQQRARR